MHTIHQKAPTLEDLLRALRRQIVEACRKEGVTYDLTFSQVEILRFIGEKGAVTMKDIAAYLKITPPSATVLVTEMEKKGLIERTGHPADRRIITITFTKKAATIFAKLSQHKHTILSGMIDRLSAKDKKSLERIITILIAS